jgi:hypothetical protein
MRVQKTLVFGGALACAAVVLAAQVSQVTMNGKVVSTSVKTINGTAYVKLSDVAKAFGMTVSKHGGSYELVASGGGDELFGVQGKMGTEFFTGKWRFLAKDMQVVDSYTPRFLADKSPITPFAPDSELVVVTCRLKNGTKEKKEIYFYKDLAGNTALTDMDEHGYSPVSIDALNTQGTADFILPGAAKDFAVVFSVPKGIKVKDMVFTVSSPAEVDKTDIRVSLNP